MEINWFTCIRLILEMKCVGDPILTCVREGYAVHTQYQHWLNFLSCLSNLRANTAKIQQSFAHTYRIHPYKHTPCVLHVETTWKRLFPRHFKLEYMRCGCRDGSQPWIWWRILYKNNSLPRTKNKKSGCQKCIKEYSITFDLAHISYLTFDCIGLLMGQKMKKRLKKLASLL